MFVFVRTSVVFCVDGLFLPAENQRWSSWFLPAGGPREQVVLESRWSYGLEA